MPSASALIYQSDRTQVFRLAPTAERGSIICKERLGGDAHARVRNEARILARLTGIDGIPRLSAALSTPTSIALEDDGGIALSQTLDAGRLQPAAVVIMALRLALIVAEVHRRGVVHKNINPTSILVSERDQQLFLVDFDFATTFAEERPGFVPLREIAGELPYLAPEQTGRTGRPVDYRADFYAMGATFYELATGRPPFGREDPLQLIHDHLARVPTPPAEVDDQIPPGLSAIIMRLLEKEPDRRYQSAEGLAYDLAYLQQQLTRGEVASFQLGERDFPLRLSPPSRLFGRNAELEHLRTAFDKALHGEARSLFIAGPPGVGKTALIDELRPLVTGRRGWFLVGKFDQYRHDMTSGPVVQVLRAIGRMLLAEPEAALAQERARIIAALGPNAARITALLPEFAVLLGPTPQVASSDPIEAEAQQRLALVDLLRVVAQARPVVIVLDDLQWAYQNSFRLVDAVLTDDQLSGLLLVCVYRDADLEVVPSWVAMRAKWERLEVAPAVLRLGNLPASDLAGMLAEMLRLSPMEASRLAATLGARTGGNPFDTVELVNGLRRDGLLVPSPDGWNWDDAAIRRYIGHGEVDCLTSRLAALPRPARRLLEIMACLGGDVGIGPLRAGAGLTIAALEERLAPAFEDGLLIMERGTDGAQSPGAAVRFRHDRIQQTVYCALKPGQRRALHLAAARRLARDAQYRTVAADQYLSVLGSIHDPAEQHRVIALFREAAAAARLTANYGAVERFLAAAMTLLDAGDGARNAPARAVVQADLHAALYNLGRHQEADELYATIAWHCGDPLELAEAACVQVNSLCSRHRLGEAVALGLDLLARLGVKIPDEAERVERLNELYRSMSAEDVGCHFRRPEVSDRRALAVSKLINRVIAPASFCHPTVMAWLVLESVRLLIEHGPCAALVSNLGLASIATIALAQDYRTGYEIARAALLAGEARGYEPETSRLAVTFASFGSHWFEPLENTLSLARRAREGLIRAGDLQFASFTYLTSLDALSHCAPTLEACATEVDAALAFAARTSNEHATAQLLIYRQLVRSLRGETRVPGGFSDGAFDEAAHLGALVANPATGVVFHAHLALTAALFGDAAKLATHAASAVPMLCFIRGLHSSVLVHLLAALALAWRATAAPADEQADLLADLDHHRDFLAQRAVDAPENLLHLVYFIDAERAWATGDGWGAASAFDAALAEAQPHQRPWQQALIAERAGLCLMAQGLNHAGRDALTKSRRAYELWGASAKVKQLEHQHGFLRESKIAAAANTAARLGSGFSSDAIDLLAVLRASQALSSQRSLERLQARIIELLEAMTGATTVLVALWCDEPAGWYLLTTGNETDMVSVEDAAARGLLPLTAVRYAERTREPLLVNDASRDYRFAADPYMAGLNCCSLLVVPVLSHGAPRALLLLENRLARGAFATDRLEAVILIAGQLAVSFDNALLYASLERRVADRTQALVQANARLEALSITDPLTGIANRRRFAQVLEAEWKRASRLRSSIGMVLVDVDHFKPYNDLYGHVAGDLCLRRVAEALSSSVRRDVDLVARYGGEEFAMILPGADRSAVHRIGERARTVVAALEEPHPHARGGFVTISAGVAAMVPSAQSSAEELVECADAALYEAKRAGRNQVRDGNARLSVNDISV